MTWGFLLVVHVGPSMAHSHFPPFAGRLPSALYPQRRPVTPSNPPPRTDHRAAIRAVLHVGGVDERTNFELIHRLLGRN